MRSLKDGLVVVAALSVLVIAAPASSAAVGCSGSQTVGSAADLNDLAACSSYGPNLLVTVGNSFTIGSGTTITPIGTGANPFVGVFDGNGETITGLTVTGAANQSGLFGVIGSPSADAEIKNLRLVNPSVSGGNEVGALVGRMTAGSITSVDVVDATVTGGESVGTLIGQVISSRAVSISGVAADGATQGSSVTVGGLIGRAHFQGAALLIEGATTSGSATGHQAVGGIVGGVSYGASSASITLRDVGSRASVATITNGVTGYGGIIGYVYDNPTHGVFSITLERAFAAGPVPSRNGTGGVIGAVQALDRVAITATAGTVFWDATATGQTNAINAAQAAVLSGPVAKTTGELTTQSTYAGWSIAPVAVPGSPPSRWTSCAGRNLGYPFLRGRYASGACLPEAPADVTATPGNGLLRLEFTAPWPGDSAITSYEYSLDGGSWTATGGASSPFTIRSLTNGQQYTVRVRALSTAGAGPPSDGAGTSPGACLGANGEALAGTGVDADPYLVATAAELRAVGTGTCALSDAYRQTADITMPAATTTGGVRSNFTPIGTPAEPFAGAFDGDGRTIDGLVYEDATAYDVGLFGSVADDADGADVRGVNVTNVSMVGSTHVGAIVGLLDGRNGTVRLQDVSSTGSVTGAAKVGGVVGRVLSWPDATAPTVAVGGVTTTVDVVAGGRAGGAIGEVHVNDAGTVSIADVYTGGDVVANGAGMGFGGVIGKLTVEQPGAGTRSALRFYDLDAQSPIEARDASRVGGLIGWIAIANASRPIRIERASATSHYLGAAAEAGGLIGYIERRDVSPFDPEVGTVELRDAYAGIPLVPQAVPSPTFGGLVGRLVNVSVADDPGGVLRLERVYASGLVPTGGNGIIGLNGAGGFSTVALTGPALWDRDATSRTTSGLSIDYAGYPTGWTTAEMQDIATFASLDWPIVRGWREPTVDRVWGICRSANGGYPFLLSLSAMSPCNVPRPPIDVVAVAGDGSATITFSPGAPGDFPTTGYEYSLDFGETVAGGTTGSPLVITGLRNGQSIYVTLRAVSDGGTGWWHTGVTVTPVAAPVVPAVSAPATRSPLGVRTPKVLRSGRLQVTVDVTGPGALAMTALPMARAGRSACTASRTVKAAGAYPLSSPHNRATPARLVKASVRLQVRVVFRPTKGAATTQTTTVTVPRRR